MLHGLEQFGVPGVEQFVLVAVTQTAEASPPATLICFMCSSVCADNNRQAEKY